MRSLNPSRDEKKFPCRQHIFFLCPPLSLYSHGKDVGAAFLPGTTVVLPFIGKLRRLHHLVAAYRGGLIVHRSFGPGLADVWTIRYVNTNGPFHRIRRYHFFHG